MSTALIVGMGLAVLSLAYVLYPLVAANRPRASQSDRPGPGAAVTPVSDEEIEAAVKAYRASHAVARACATCGPRPESDAVFCSNCGSRVGGA